MLLEGKLDRYIDYVLSPIADISYISGWEHQNVLALSSNLQCMGK